MKKILPAFLIYLGFASIACFCFGFFSAYVPSIVTNGIASYKVHGAFLFLFKYIPSITFTAFLLGCSLGFGSLDEGSGSRFSASISALFQQIMIFAIALTFLLTLTRQVLIPISSSNKTEAERRPALVEECLSLGQQHLNMGEPVLAQQYASRVLAMEPGNRASAELKRNAELAAEELEGQRIENAKRLALEEIEADQARYKEDDTKLTVYELLQKSKEAFDKEDYFGAHYYATRASRLADLRDTNREDAIIAATEAWNKLMQAQTEMSSEDNLFFRKKLQGYKELNAGDNLEAYYIFRSLELQNQKYARDPDVVRYLEEASRRVKEDYFFVDETYDKSRFEDGNDIYFSIRHPDGSYDVITIQGVTEVEGNGGLVKYLRDLKINSFDKTGQFFQSVSASYAKMSAFDTSNLSKEDRIKLGIDLRGGKKLIIPSIMLCAVDRDKQNERSVPVYKFRGNFIGEEKNQTFLAMPYEDFSLVVKACHGTESMNPFALHKMSRIANQYGFSQEVFAEASLFKIFYPCIVLISLVFIASVAWNYRLKANSIFKFVWIFVLPILNVIFYFIVEFCEYIIKLFDYIFLAAAGITWALFVGAAIYIFILIAVCVVFLSRKGD